MKKTKTFSVEEAVYTNFEKISDEKFLNKSQWIESKIQEYVEYNTFKDNFGANDVLGKISDRITEFIDEDAYIQEQLKKVSDKSILLTTLKMDSNFHRIEIRLEPKYPFDPKATYSSPVDDEIVSIVDSTLNYVILSNGNKLRVKDFHKLYSLVIDPDRFFKGELSLVDCVSDTKSTSENEIQRLARIRKATNLQEAIENEKIQRTNNIINKLKEKHNSGGVVTATEVVEDFSKALNIYSVDQIDDDNFFRKGREELFGIATKILQCNTDGLDDYQPTIVKEENSFSEQVDKIRQNKYDDPFNDPFNKASWSNIMRQREMALKAGGCTVENEEPKEEYPKIMTEQERNDLLNQVINSGNLSGPKIDDDADYDGGISLGESYRE